MPQTSAIPPPGVLSPSTLHSATSAASATSISSTESQIPHVTNEEYVKQKQEELQKKLNEEGEPTLQQQESMSIKGQNARHLVMQRLMRPRDSKVVILRNMVGPEDVDETLQEEIQEECSKFGVVDKVIIYKEKQTDNDDDDFDDVIVKIFVEFSMSSGEWSFHTIPDRLLTWSFYHCRSRQSQLSIKWTLLRGSTCESWELRPGAVWPQRLLWLSLTSSDERYLRLTFVSTPEITKSKS